MNQNLFRPELKGTQTAHSLSLLSTIVFALGIFFAALSFLFFCIMGVAALATADSAGTFLLMLFFGILSGVSVFIASYVISVLLKGLASIVLHTYISALNSEKIADNTRKTTIS